MTVAEQNEFKRNATRFYPAGRSVGWSVSEDEEAVIAHSTLLHFFMIKQSLRLSYTETCEWFDRLYANSDAAHLHESMMDQALMYAINLITDTIEQELKTGKTKIIPAESPAEFQEAPRGQSADC